MAPRDRTFHFSTAIHRGTRFTLALMVGAVALLVALWSGLAEKAGFALYDAQMRWQLAERGANPNTSGDGSAAGASRDADAPIVLVAIDQSSLDWVQKELGLGWPWPRELYGVMAGYLRGARAQAWDILFTEASTYGPEDDARCANAMSAAGNVALATLVGKVPVFGAANLALGHVAADVDHDGICRKYRVWIERGGEKVPALGLAALEVAAKGWARDGVMSSGSAHAAGAVDGTVPSAPIGGASRFSVPGLSASSEIAAILAAHHLCALQRRADS